MSSSFEIKALFAKQIFTIGQLCQDIGEICQDIELQVSRLWRSLQDFREAMKPRFALEVTLASLRSEV